MDTPRHNSAFARVSALTNGENSTQTPHTREEDDIAKSDCEESAPSNQEPGAESPTDELDNTVASINEAQGEHSNLTSPDFPNQQPKVSAVQPLVPPPFRDDAAERERRMSEYGERYENFKVQTLLSRQKLRYLQQREKFFDDRRKTVLDRLHDIELEKGDLVAKLEDIEQQKALFVTQLGVDVDESQREIEVLNSFEDYFALKSDVVPVEDSAFVCYNS